MLRCVLNHVFPSNTLIRTRLAYHQNVTKQRRTELRNRA